MSITFETLADASAILIKASGHVDASEVETMRCKTVELTNETGFSNYIVDISDLQSIASGDTFATYELGDAFRSTGIRFQTRTAVIMPEDHVARRQAEFLHTVELNRGRGDIRYVTSAAEALEWFAAVTE
jgi:anti-anti-sigma regulatory factor